MIYKDIIQLLACVFEAVITLTFFSSYGDKRRGFTFWEYVLGALVLGILIWVISAVFSLKALNFGLTVLATWAVLFYYSGNLKRNFILIFLSEAAMWLSEIIVIFIMTFVTGETASVTGYGFTGEVCSKLLAFITVKAVCIWHKDDSEHAGKILYWILLLSIFLINVTACYLLYLFQDNNPDGGIYNILAVFCCFGLLYSTFLVFYLYKNVIKQSEEEYRQKSYKQHEKEQIKYIGEVMSSQNKIKKLCHDLKNHNIALRAYFESGDTEGGLTYLDNLDKMTAQMSPGSVNTGNIVIDALVNNKQRIAEEKNIKFTAFLQVPTRLFMDATDICIIFGNALDNAIEACEKVKDRERRISLHAIYENNSLICQFKNTAPKDSDLNLNTTKKNKSDHGFGIENIKTALSNYNSMYKISVNNSIFTLSIVINFE